MSRAGNSIAAALRRWLKGALDPENRPAQRVAPPADPELTLVALILNATDQALLARLAAENHWRIYFASTREEAWKVLNEHQAQIILCEREGPGTDWRGMVRKMVSAPHLVCVILISHVADNYLWNEVNMWGGHDVLATPLHERNVVRAIRLAWLYWNSTVKSGLGVA